MSDTTAYLAGCATTGVAALVLLVARVGMVTSPASTDKLAARVDRIESATPSQSALADARAEQQLEDEIRRELDKQRDLTERLESQLAQQENLANNLENKIRQQEEKTQEMLARIQLYQRSVEDIELQDQISAAARPAEPARPVVPPATILWLGAGVVVVLVVGGGGLIVCAVLLILQSQKRSARPAPLPPPMPMPPAPDYRHYNQNLLPPAQFRPKRPTYYDYPPPPYDYTP